MPTEPQPPSLAEVVRRAVEICDPRAEGPIADFLAEFEDRDEPITAVAELQDEAVGAAHRVDPAQADPAVTMAAAVTTYLGFKREALDADDTDVLRLAARSEFDAHPPELVASWLLERGVQV